VERVLREVKDRLVSTNAQAGFTYVFKKEQPGLIWSPRLDKLTTSLASSKSGVKVLKSLNNSKDWEIQGTQSTYATIIS